MKWKWTYTPMIFNYGCFAVGMVAVWHLTHDWWVLLWAFVASIHVTFSIKQEAP